MSKATEAARAKAERFCGGGMPGMRKRREDGGAAGEGNSSTAGDSGSSGTTDIAIAPQPAPAPAPVKKPEDEDPTKKPAMGMTTPGDGSPKPLNSQVLRDGGRATARRRYG